MKLLPTLAAATLSLAALTAPVAAAPVVLDFDAITPGDPVDGFYSGQGVTFAGFLTTTGFGETSEPNLAYVDGVSGTVDTTFAFTKLSFTAGFFTSGTLQVFSGSGGTGTLLFSQSGVLGDPFAFQPYSFSWVGDAASFTLFNSDQSFGALGIDDLVFNAVPEPATWTLLIGGFAMTGLALRRRAALTT